MPAEQHVSEITTPDADLTPAGAAAGGRRHDARRPSTAHSPDISEPVATPGPTGTTHRGVRRVRGSVMALAVMAAIAGGLFARALGQTPMNETDSSVAGLQQQAESNPQDPAGWQRLGDAHLATAVINDDTVGYLAATSALERSADLDPTQVEVTRSLAVAAVGLHRFAEARDLARAAIEQQPDDRITLAALIDAQLELGLYAEAKRTADRLAALRPDATSLSRLSYLHQLSGDTDQALDLMYRARTAASGAPEAQARLSLFLAEIHRERGEYDLAAQRYDEAMDEPSTVARAIVGRAEVALVEGDTSRARQLLDRPGVDQAGLAAILATARLSEAEGDEQALLEHLLIARDITEQSIAANIGIEASAVQLEADLGDATRARALADTLLEAQPDNIGAQHAAAWAAYRLGDIADATRFIDRALRTGREEPTLLAHAAAIRAAAGDVEAARALYERATGIDPGVTERILGVSPATWSAIAPRATTTDRTTEEGPTNP